MRKRYKDIMNHFLKKEQKNSFIHSSLQINIHIFILSNALFSLNDNSSNRLLGVKNISFYIEPNPYDCDCSPHKAG